MNRSDSVSSEDSGVGIHRHDPDQIRSRPTNGNGRSPADDNEENEMVGLSDNKNDVHLRVTNQGRHKLVVRRLNSSDRVVLFLGVCI